MKLRIISTILIISSAAASEYTIYKKDERDIYAPIKLYINGAFDVAQDRDFFSQHNFVDNHGELMKRVTSPFHSIERDGGYKRFWNDQFIGKPAFPNYALHLVGSGYDYRYIREWYEDGNYPLPTLLAVTTIYAAHIGNEAMELSNKKIDSQDHIADLFFFDSAAILLFSNDSVSKFFQDKAYMRNWSHQPYISASDGHIVNAGLSYSVRPNLFDSKWRPFGYTGMQTLFGLSYFYANKSSISAGSGVTFKDPLEGTYYVVSGVFYEEDDNLVASLFINGSDYMKLRLNLYPQLFKFKSVDLGSMIGLDREDKLALGVNVSMPLGIGI